MRRIIATIVTALSLVLGTAVVGAIPANAGGHCHNYVYKKTGTGTCVKAIQVLVMAAATKRDVGRNFVRGNLVVDGKFGRATEAAVKMLQMQNSLKVDGVVGANTWYILCNRHYKTTKNETAQVKWAYKYACV